MEKVYFLTMCTRRRMPREGSGVEFLWRKACVHDDETVQQREVGEGERESERE